jgi:hypothetical protein
MLSYKIPCDIVSENMPYMTNTIHIVLLVVSSNEVQMGQPIRLISRTLRGRFDDVPWLGLLKIILIVTTFNVNQMLVLLLVVHMRSQ